MLAYVSKFAEAKSTIGDSRPLTSAVYSPEGDRVATTSWSGDCKVNLVLFTHSNDIRFGILTHVP